MVRRNVSAMKVGRCVAFLAATAVILPFTILVLVADQQFHFAYNSRKAFYQESDFYKLNSTFLEPEQLSSTNSFRSQLLDSNLTVEGFLSKERLLEIGARMDRRRELMETECSNLELDNQQHKASAWEYLINREYHVIWCNIFKAASTSWMYNFNLMANYSAKFLDQTKEVPLELARKRYGRPSITALKKAQEDSITFLIVRHPLERLASAYNDKIVHAWPMSFHAQMAKRIIKTYRSPKSSTQRVPQFEEFVRFVLDEVRHHRSLDMHWAPYNEFCTPCKFHIDVILKFETLDEDQKFLIQVAKLQDVVKPEWKNSGFGNTREKISDFYSQITKSQLEGLYSLYRYDFHLFNYTLDGYNEIVRDG